MGKVLLASNNPGKLREMRAVLEEFNLAAMSPQDLDLELEVEEAGNTYAENAARKAQAFARRSGMLSLADDSGLEVEALGGAPGIHSRRYAPQPGATDADRRRLLLQALQSAPRPWIARFHCTVALAEPDGLVHFSEGECPGEIIPEERGTGGFGYDPIFLVSGLGRTMAELTMEEKNQVSHRARALRAALPVLLRLL